MTPRITLTFLAGALIVMLQGAPGVWAAGYDTPAVTSVDQMPPQMRTAYIVGIQEALAAHGYRVGPADGALGQRTLRAVRRYQRDAGLAVDGVASKELLDHLLFAQPKVYARSAPSGTSVIAEIQGELRQLGYYRDQVDGIAGPRTRAAVRAFSQDAGLGQGARLDRNLLDQIRSSSLSLDQ